MASLALSDDELDRLAGALAPRLARLVAADGASGATSSWLDASEAAAHLRCPVSRIRKLTMTGALPHHRDGRRVLYRRDELDRYVLGVGSTA